MEHYNNDPVANAGSVSPVTAEILQGGPAQGVIVHLRLAQASLSLWLADLQEIFTEEFDQWRLYATLTLYRVALEDPSYVTPFQEILQHKKLFSGGSPSCRVRYVGNYYRKKPFGDYGRIGHLFLIDQKGIQKAVLWDRKGDHQIFTIIPVRDEYDLFDRIIYRSAMD
jgi:hypothetical protein